MNNIDLKLELALIVIMVCFLVHIVFSELLKNSLAKKATLYNAIFTKTKLVAIGHPRMELPSSIRLKCLLPFSVNVKGIGAVGTVYLYITRIAAWGGVLVLARVLLFLF